MNPYLISLAIGLLVGVIYALFKVRSPAPPVIALAGLLGMLLGEQIPPLVKNLWAKETVALSISEQTFPPVAGKLAKGRTPAQSTALEPSISHATNTKEA